jgi:tight adherence protein C
MVLIALTSSQVFLITFVVTTIVAAGSFSVYTMLFPTVTPDDRLEMLTIAAESDGEMDANARARALESLAARLGRLAENNDVDANERMRRTLMYAGYKNRRGLEVFNGIRVAAAVLMPVVTSLVLFNQETLVIAFGILLGIAIGYYFPILVLNSQATTRQAELLRSYPDALDLMVSSVESGLSLDQAFRRVALEMRSVSLTLSKEFNLVNSQVSAGIDRITALKRLEERTGVEEIRSFVNTLAQAERFGSSIAASLRLYSQVAREKRMARAEEKAGAVGSKLTVLMIIFFLPVLMAILISPVGLRWYYGEGEA